MINNEPLPLVEAMIFLSNRAAGFSWKAYIEEKTGCEPKNRANARLRRYGGLLVELEHRLDSRIEASEDTLARLFKPIRRSGRGDGGSLGECVAEMLIPGEMETFLIRDSASFMARIRENTARVPCSVLENVTGESAEPSGAPELKCLLSAIIGSDLAPESKLLLIDVLADTDKYVNMLEEALLPVACEFERCGSLTAPLLDVYVKNYRDASAEKVIRGRLRNTDDAFSDFIMYPLIIGSHSSVFAFDDGRPPRVMGCIGAIHDFIRDSYAFSSGSELGLDFMMYAVGNRTRFGIIERLLHGPAYGRELASHLDISPATVSLHISVLVNAGLVTVKSEGTRAYYLLNRGNVVRLAERLRAMFSPDAGAAPGGEPFLHTASDKSGS